MKSTNKTNKTNHALCGLLSGLLLLAAGTSTTCAGVVYADSFSRSGILDSSAPDVTNSPGQTWIASGASTVGSTASIPGSKSAFLPVTITSGNIYTLQADLDTDSDDNNWVGLVFSNTANPNGVFQVSNPTSHILFALVGDGFGLQDQGYAFGGMPAGQVDGPSGGNGFHNIKIVLDTTAAEWTATFYRDTLQFGVPVSYAINPSFSYVGFGTTGDFSGTADNFTFATAPVPEPTSALLLLGSGALLLLRRRRTAV